ncbi:MAG: YkgJ family cysteine cluster protein [Cyclobacteriaceae bacterium]|nr:YkgJ family cysteine cluster protein [Cyclobacteriaceae bacterium]
MSLDEKVNAIEQVFEKLDAEISQFQGWSGLHCKWGCGKCCFKPDIEATILEFLPFANWLYHTEKAFEWLERLTQTDESICLILNPTQAGAGLCTEYKHRGLICRLFGFSARTTKHGSKELVTCEIIKTEQAELYTKAAAHVEQEKESVPVMHNYYMQLHAIDYELTRDFYPINQAIQKAIETVLAYYAYRTK